MDATARRLCEDLERFSLVMVAALALLAAALTAVVTRRYALASL
ncbi:MAG: hypothetical protein AAF170_06690 [Bacteroidota bacterium]